LLQQEPAEDLLGKAHRPQVAGAKDVGEAAQEVGRGEHVLPEFASGEGSLGREEFGGVPAEGSGPGLVGPAPAGDADAPRNPHEASHRRFPGPLLPLDARQGLAQGDR